MNIHERDRLEALKSYGLLDTPAHSAFDAVTQAAKAAFDVPIALVSLVDETRQWFKSCIGLDVRETARDISFCTHAIGQSDVYVVPDAEADLKFAENPLVTGSPFIRFYAGSPLIDADGYALGTLCIIDTKPRRFPAKDRALLRALGQCALSAIELHSKTALLDRANTLLQRYMARSSGGG
jgi:GAF domain-containing protein